MIDFDAEIADAHQEKANQPHWICPILHIGGYVSAMILGAVLMDKGLQAPTWMVAIIWVITMGFFLGVATRMR